jgi:hypothetical protein
MSKPNAELVIVLTFEEAEALLQFATIQLDTYGGEDDPTLKAAIKVLRDTVEAAEGYDKQAGYGT